ncbi:hypothetical protein [Yoonia sp. SDW83-1]|uniref:hypothetical protein n=1 Tax=Yoonia sp. SDW83-1 TaxID=3366945 RepID=UPI00398C2B74
MARTQVFMLLVAIAAAIWRLNDPTGSYGTLLEISKFLTRIFSEKDLIRTGIGMLLVDQFNGFIVGIFAASILPVCVLLGKCVAKSF